MSFPKKGKSFPKKGKSFPKRGGGGGSDFSLDDHAFAMKIASALTSELKDRNSRAKLVAGWTGANERTVKNWISGRYAPCGRRLIVLAQHSDQVLNAILSMADRQESRSKWKRRGSEAKVLELTPSSGSKPGWKPRRCIRRSTSQPTTALSGGVQGGPYPAMARGCEIRSLRSRAGGRRRPA
jgi:hypothetical protein